MNICFMAPVKMSQWARYMVVVDWDLCNDHIGNVIFNSVGWKKLYSMVNARCHVRAGVCRNGVGEQFMVRSGVQRSILREHWPMRAAAAAVAPPSPALAMSHSDCDSVKSGLAHHGAEWAESLSRGEVRPPRLLSVQQRLQWSSTFDQTMAPQFLEHGRGRSCGLQQQPRHRSNASASRAQTTTCCFSS